MSWYPSIDDPDFYNKLYLKQEFRENVQKIEGVYQEPYQQFVRKFINRDTPYESILLLWELGSGKTTGSISILENFRYLSSQNIESNKFLIITKNKFLQNVFFDEIIKDPLSSYVSERERKKIQDGDEYIRKVVKARIRNYYEFINYDEFVNRVIGRRTTTEITKTVRREVTSSKGNIQNFNNRIIVIDEIQNITGNYRYFSLLQVLKNSVNTRLIMLTATPITNNVEEMIYVSNLLNFKNPPFPFDEKDIELEKSSDQIKDLNILYKKGILNREKIDNIKQIVSVFTTEGEKMLLNSLKGKVSYIPIDPSTFPKRIRIGDPLTPKKGSLQVVKCPMSPFQQEVYLKNANTSLSAFDDLPSYLCTMTYEAPIENAHQSSFLKKEHLKKEYIAKYSSKLYQILNNIENSPGPVFIYSNNVKTSGTKLIAEMLKVNGYQQYKEESKNTKNSYILFSQNLNESQRQKYKNIINDPKNKDGSLVKIIIGSPLISEGLSFLRVRQVHILDPYWNLARILQAEGRCIRNYSHFDLAEKEREVKIFWYMATLDPRLNIKTSDEIKYILCEEKDRVNKKIERKLKEIAIDCYNLQQITKFRKEKNKELYDLFFQDYSRDCDYQKCEYECQFIDINSVKSDKFDDSTYNQYTDPQQIRLAKKHIQNLVSKGNAWDLESLLKTEELKYLTKYNVYFALEELVSKETLFYVPGKGQGKLIYSGKYYKFYPIRQEEKQNTKNLIEFFTAFQINDKKEEQINVQMESQKEKEPKKQQEENPVLGKIDRIERFIENKGNMDIFGIREENKFKIVDLTKYKQTSTGRDKPRGRQCSTLGKDNLDDIRKRLGLSLVNKTKNDICKEIYSHLKKEDLILNFDDQS